MKNKVTLKRNFFLKIILTTFITIVLFILTFFIIIIPRFEESIMEGKRQTIKELTNSAISILDEYYLQQQTGILSKEEAQQKAKLSIEYLRYGVENKDYFWITDLQPKMIMHPYRKELNDQDLSDYKDLSGKNPFVEFVNIVKENNEGYVEYLWQWKDDSLHVVPKLSFVKKFDEWNWIVGTGVYIDDVKFEISKLKNNLIKISLGITLIMACLLFFISQQGIKAENLKIIAEESLKESREKYKTLVESATEGTILILNNKIAFANNTILKILNYNSQEIENLNIHNIITGIDESFDLLSLNNSERKIKANNDKYFDVKITVKSISYSDKEGLIIGFKDLSDSKIIETELKYSKDKYKTLFNTINFGIFKISLDIKGYFIEANNATLKILGYDNFDELKKVQVINTFVDKDEFRSFSLQLATDNLISNKKVKLLRKDNTVVYANVSIVLVKDESKNPLFFEGLIEDITANLKTEQEKNDFISEIQSLSLQYQQPVEYFKRPLLKCDMYNPISKVAQILKKNNSDAILISDEQKNLLAYTTISDITKRSIAENKNSNASVFEIMTSPINSIYENTPVYKILDLFEETKNDCIVLKDNTNKFTGFVFLKDLIQIHNTFYHNLILGIRNSSTFDELKIYFKNIKIITRPLIENGADIRILSDIISTFSDEITKRLIFMVQEEIGQAPVKFAFISLGSEGRKEQTLATDQDNAIIFENTNEKINETYDYFNKMGEKICDALNFIGFDYCKGNIMAKNPKWCKPLNVWKNYFENWITEPTPENLLEISIFFDFRYISGDNSLVDDLYNHITKLAPNNSLFLFHLAQNANYYKVPLNKGNITLESSGKHINTFNIKNTIVQIVMLARIYALKNNINQTNTIERLNGLLQKQIINQHFFDEIKFNYNFLMSFRYKHQLKQILNNKEADNNIELTELLNIEQTILKNICSQISGYQQKLNLDFKGNYL